MSNENEEIDKASNAKDSPFMRKVKGYAVGIASLVSSVSGLAQNQPNELPQQDKEPVAQETTYVAPQTENDDNTYVMQGVNSEIENLIDRRTSTNTNNSGRYYFKIGNISNKNIATIPSSGSGRIDKNTKIDFRSGLIRDTYELSTKDEFNELMNERGNGFAYCNGGSYNLPNYKISGELEHLVDSVLTDNELRAKLTPDILMQFEYMKKNPIAEILIKTHEVDIHGHHEEQGTVSNSSFSPYMSAVSSDMTERLAYFGEYIALTMLHNTMKNAGMETMVVDGRDIPLENILDYKEGLKETIDKFGSDVSSSKFIEEIAKLSNDKWIKYQEEGYTNQAQNHTAAAENAGLMDMIICARKWDKTQMAMIQGIKILDQDVHIPKDCLQYFKPSDERISSILGDDYISNDDLLNIDKYLDSIGLKNDEDKAYYIIEQSVKINNRDNDADLNLRNLFLACGKDNSGTIEYSDGIIDNVSNDGTVVISERLGNTEFNSSLQQLDNAVGNPKNAQELKETLSKIVVTPEKLSPEQVLSNDLANITVKTEDAKTNQINLDMIKLTQIDR